MNDATYPFVRLPIDLLNDSRLSAPEQILWCRLDEFARERDERGQRKPPDIKALQKKMDAGERSIYRWLKKLEATGWLEWQRFAERDERLTPLTPADRARRPEGDVIAHAQHLIADGHATIEDYRTTLRAVLNLLVEGLPPESDLPPESNLPPVANPLPPGSAGLIGGSNSLPPGSAGLIGGSNSLPPGSAGLIVVADLGAAHGVPMRCNGDHETHEKKETHEIHQTPSEESGGGGEALRLWLTEHGMGRAAAARHQHHDAEAAKADFARNVGDAQGEEREWRIGRLVLRWDELPPQPAAPVAESQRDSLISKEEAERRARAIAPEGATEEDVQVLAGEIWAGSSDDQALDYLATRQARDAYLAGAAT